jgi:biopolymer transport protein ExbD
MKWRRESEQAEALIDLSPLIDIVFILLIFFMVTTTFAKDLQMDIERPQASSGVPVEESTLRVQIDASGLVFVDGEQVRPWNLSESVRNQLRNRAQKTVLVVSDRSTPAQALIDVVDGCRLGGATHVGVATEGRESGS